MTPRDSLPSSLQTMAVALADRIDAAERGWLPISGHVVNVTFSLDEADMVSAALRAAPADEIADLRKANQILQVLVGNRDKEIDRLRAASTGEPVAWQCRFNVGGWLEWKQVDQPIEIFRKKAKHNIDIGSCEIRPVYAAPASGDVRADVSAAKDYVDRAIASYQGDPADNQFQKGFLAALEVVRDEAFAGGRHG